MIKFLKFIQALLVILYILVNIYLMVFNWDVYTVSMDLNYGFGSFSAPLFLVVETIGLILIFLLWLTVYSKDLRYEISKLKREKDIHTKNSDTLADASEGSVMSLNERVSQLQKQMDELADLLKKSESLDIDSWRKPLAFLD